MPRAGDVDNDDMWSKRASASVSVARERFFRPLLADAILLFHALVVLFVIGGTLYIWVGAWRGWRGVRAPLFRYTHLCVMLFVTGEALLGLMCPLTVWEDALRGAAQRSGFVSRWVGRLIYYDLPAWVFTTAYVALAIALIVTLVLLPPGRASDHHRTST